MRILIIGFGYIGSYLSEHLSNAGHELTICSRSFSEYPKQKSNWTECAYQDLENELIDSHDAILWFAGHSSVSEAIDDPEGAVDNNCFGLLKLARAKSDSIPLIYASTASLYSVSHDPDLQTNPPVLAENEAIIASLNPYDSSKAAFDALSGTLCSNTLGLRLGTLCGNSPNLRKELIFNAMNISAIENGVVNVANGSAWRSILFLEDLAAVIDQLLHEGTPLSGFMNLASFDIQISVLAETIAKWHNVPVVVGPHSRTYSFRMDVTRMQTIYQTPKHMTLEKRCEEFHKEFLASEDTQ